MTCIYKTDLKSVTAFDLFLIITRHKIHLRAGEFFCRRQEGSGNSQKIVSILKFTLGRECAMLIKVM